MDTKERPCYQVLTKARWLNLFDGKLKYLGIMFHLFQRIDRFQWLKLKFNRYPYSSDGWSVCRVELDDSVAMVNMEK